MAKLPMYTQRYQQGARRGSAEDMGAAEGRARVQAGAAQQNLGGAIMQASDQFAQLEVRRRNREDTINRVRAINEYRQLAEQEATRTSTEDDLTSTDVPKNYGTFLNSELGRIVSEHGGSSSSKAELETQLLNIQGAYSRDMYKQSTAAQFKAMDTHLSTVIRQAADAVGDAPSTLNEYFVQIDAEIEMMSAALTPEQEVAYKETARAQLIASAASTEMARGNYESVEAMLADPIAESTLDPDTMRQLKTKLIVGSRQEQLEAAAFQSKVNAIEQVAGPLTKAQKLQLAGISSTSGGTQTTAQKIAEFETVVGRPATAQEIQKFYNVGSQGESASGPFGASLRGRSLAIANDGYQQFGAGMMDPESEAHFLTAVNELTKPETYKDPDTGVLMTRVPTLPAHLELALAKRGYEIPGRGGEDMPAPVLDSVDIDPSQTIWARRGNIAGIGPAAARAAGRVPGAGDLIEGGGVYARDYQYVSGLQRDLVRVLQNNPRYAEGERKAIESEVSILSSVMDSESAYTQRLVGLDESLASRQDFAYKTANSPNVPASERQQAMNILNAIVQFRAKLGVPIKVKSKEEAAKLPPGTEFVDPNGILRMVPGGAQ